MGSHERSWDQLPGRCLAPTLHPAPGGPRGCAGGLGGDAGVSTGDKLSQGRRARGWQPTGSVGSILRARGWMGHERCTAGPGAAPDLLDFPEKIKPGAGRVRLLPSSAGRFTRAQRRKMERFSMKG